MRDRIINKLIFGAFLVCLVWVVGCSAQSARDTTKILTRANIRKIKDGMTSGEVRAILGFPSKTEFVPKSEITFANPEGNFDRSIMTWKESSKDAKGQKTEVEVTICFKYDRVIGVQTKGLDLFKNVENINVSVERTGSSLIVCVTNNSDDKLNDMTLVATWRKVEGGRRILEAKTQVDCWQIGAVARIDLGKIISSEGCFLEITGHGQPDGEDAPAPRVWKDVFFQDSTQKPQGR